MPAIFLYDDRSGTRLALGNYGERRTCRLTPCGHSVSWSRVLPRFENELPAAFGASQQTHREMHVASATPRWAGARRLHARAGHGVRAGALDRDGHADSESAAHRLVRRRPTLGDRSVHQRRAPQPDWASHHAGRLRYGRHRSVGGGAADRPDPLAGVRLPGRHGRHCGDNHGDVSGPGPCCAGAGPGCRVSEDGDRRPRGAQGHNQSACMPDGRSHACYTTGASCHRAATSFTTGHCRAHARTRSTLTVHRRCVAAGFATQYRRAGTGSCPSRAANHNRVGTRCTAGDCAGALDRDGHADSESAARRLMRSGPALGDRSVHQRRAPQPDHRVSRHAGRLRYGRHRRIGGGAADRPDPLAGVWLLGRRGRQRGDGHGDVSRQGTGDVGAVPECRVSAGGDRRPRGAEGYSQSASVPAGHRGTCSGSAANGGRVAAGTGHRRAGTCACASTCSGAAAKSRRSAAGFFAGRHRSGARACSSGSANRGRVAAGSGHRRAGTCSRASTCSALPPRAVAVPPVSLPAVVAPAPAPAPAAPPTAVALPPAPVTVAPAPAPVPPVAETSVSGPSRERPYVPAPVTVTLALSANGSWYEPGPVAVSLALSAQGLWYEPGPVTVTFNLSATGSWIEPKPAPTFQPAPPPSTLEINGDNAMTISERRRLRISIATLGLFFASAGSADRAFGQAAPCTEASVCVTLTLNANVQVTKLHPLVTGVGMKCDATLSTAGLGTYLFGTPVMTPVVNRGYTGTLVGTLNVPRSVLDDPAKRTLPVTCNLRLFKAGGPSVGVNAVASAAVPETITDTNWTTVATGSTIRWNEAVTFPSAP